MFAPHHVNPSTYNALDPHAVVVLVGNKADLENSRTVSVEEAVE